MSNVLIDTSAWVEFFRADGDVRYRTAVGQLLDDNRAALCGVVLAEILKGARTEREYRELDDRLSTLVYLQLPETIWRKVGRHAYRLLRKGVRVPTTDLVIATVALENKVSVMHKDRHFPLLSKHIGLDIFSL